MANPFLFMEEEVAAVSAVPNDAFQNPFLVEDEEEEVGDFPSENPFSASNPFAFTASDNDANNMFANNNAVDMSQSGANFFLTEDDDEEEELQMQQQQEQNLEQHVDPTMSFFGTTINEHDDLQYNSNENDISHDLVMKTMPPQRPPPATQQMIDTLTDHLDQTSTNLLGKLPATRSPSPVSMRDLHSPSPTPDVGDLLDVSDAFAAATEAEKQTINHEEHKPSRPPPPRPVPPRPTPPVTASTPIQAVNTTTVTQPVHSVQPHHPHEDDLFDVFGTGHKKPIPPPKPPAPKTKEDILSLFQAPTQPVQEPKKQDLLSDDIDFSIQHPQETKKQSPVEEKPKQQTPQSNVAVVQPFVDEVPSIPQAVVEPMIVQQEQTIIEAVEQLTIQNHIPNSRSIPTITEDLTEDRPQSDFMDPPEEPVQQKSEVSSPTESGITSGGIPASGSGSILNMTMPEMEITSDIQTEQPAQVEANPFITDKTPTPQNEQLQFLTQKSASYQSQRPTTPDPIVARPEFAPIFNVDPTPQAIKPSKPPPPIRGGSVLTTVQQSVPMQQQHHVSNPLVPDIQQTDEFDDFAAKFESTGQIKTTGNAFLDSLAVESSGDAWGDSSDAFGAVTVTNPTDGFGNEDGFDSWDVPAAPESTPYAQRKLSSGSIEEKDLSVTIKPKTDFDYVTAPALAPPSKSPYSGSVYSEGKLGEIIFKH